MSECFSQSLCPLCNGGETVQLATIRIAELRRLYKKTLSIDLGGDVDRNGEMTLCKCQKCELTFFHPSMSGSPQFYESIQKLEWYYQDEKAEYQVAAQYIKESDSVLEIGCGKGAFAKIIQTSKYTGLEYNAEAVKRGSQGGVNVYLESIQQHSENNSESYNVVCLFQVLEHVTDLRHFIKCAVKCLRPKGKLICSVPSADSFLKHARNLATNLPPHHVTWWSDRALSALGELFELDVLNICHERLADIHKKWYLSILCQNIINKKFDREWVPIDNSIFYKLIAQFSHLFANMFEEGIDDESMRANGHSVIGVYEKREIAGSVNLTGKR